jgi:hypothetical protein
MKTRKGHCSKHPMVRLSKGQTAHGRKTGCRACVQEYRARMKPKREVTWRKATVMCARHPERRAIRSCFISSGTRRCSRCHRYRADGTRRPAGLRYERKATVTGHRAAWAAKRRRLRRIEANAW